jgi:hypothetical protein
MQDSMPIQNGGNPPQVQYMNQSAVPARTRATRRPREDNDTWTQYALYAGGALALGGWEAVSFLAERLFGSWGEALINVVGTVCEKMGTFRTVLLLGFGARALLLTERGQRLASKVSPYGPSKSTMKRAMNVFQKMNANHAFTLLWALNGKANVDRNNGTRPVIAHKQNEDGSVKVDYVSEASARPTMDAAILLKALPILSKTMQHARMQNPVNYAAIINWLEDGEGMRIDDFKDDMGLVKRAFYGIQGYDDLLTEAATEARTGLGLIPFAAPTTPDRKSVV